MRKFWKNLAAAAVGVLLSQNLLGPSVLFAQDPSDFIRRMDTNGNGMIDPDEAQGRSRSMLERMAQSNPRINLSRPIPIETVTREMERMRSGFGGGGQSERGGRGGGGGNFGGGGFGGGGFNGGGFGGAGGNNGPSGQQPGGRSSRNNGTDESGNPTPTLLEGFGNQYNDTPVLGFGADQEQNLSGIKPTSEDEQRMDRTLRQNDRNNDGVIEGEEIENGRWDDGDPKLYDTNRDGRLTKNELLIRAAKKRVADEAEEKAEREQRSRDREQRGDRGDRGDRFAMFGGGFGGGGFGGGGFGGGGFGGGGFGGWGGGRGGEGGFGGGRGNFGGGGPGGNMMAMMGPGGEGGGRDGGGRGGRGGRGGGEGGENNEGEGGGRGGMRMSFGGPPGGGMGGPPGMSGMGGPPGMGGAPGMGGEGGGWGGGRGGWGGGGERGGDEGGGNGGDRMLARLEEGFARADEDKSGSLEQQEWNNLRGTNGDDLDKDKNQIITKQEYLEGVSERFGIKLDPSAFAYKPTGPMTYRAKDVKDKIKEKHPDVPTWFWTEDKDGDGQISMAEHSSSWTDARVAEWIKIDTNGDGMWSIQEVVASTKAAPTGIVVAQPRQTTNGAAPNAMASNGQPGGQNGGDFQGRGPGGEQRNGGGEEGRRSRNNSQQGLQISEEEAKEQKADRSQRWGQVGSGGSVPSYDVPADLPATIDKTKANRSAKFFAQEDKNKDGFLTSDEMENCKDADKNGDGKADIKEYILFKNG